MTKVCCLTYLKRLVALVSPGVLLLLFLALQTQKLKAEEMTFVYAVQISAAVQISPPQITLNWEPDPFGANNYTIYRKSKSDTAWGSGTTVSGSVSNYTDTAVAVGVTY